jgi:hypothetical protein
MPLPRPPFLSMWTQFNAIYGSGSVVDVGKKIGGKVGQNIELGAKDPVHGFTNACAIRMSFSLNYAGTTVSRGIWQTVSGADGKWYIYRVSDLLKFLKSTFGKPDKTIKNPKRSDFNGMKGILVFGVDWNDASGHATLWDGVGCSDHCYFPIAQEASIWILK